jgi:hypothetical protein
MIRRALSVLLPVSLLTAGGARADPPLALDGPPPTLRSEAPPEHTWLFQDEPQIASPLQAVAASRITYTSTGSSPTRPFASNLATPGAMLELGGEVGVLPGISLQATGVVGESGQVGATAAGAVAGLRWAVLPAEWRATHLVLSAGYLRELSGGDGAWARATLAQDIGRTRVAATVHAEHVFAAGRDGVDAMVIAGAHYRVAGPLRLGAEYVGQDLEEAFADASEGGVRHFVGPTASLELLQGRLAIVGGPAVGLSYRSPQALGRVGVAWAF